VCAKQGGMVCAFKNPCFAALIYPRGGGGGGRGGGGTLVIKMREFLPANGGREKGGVSQGGEGLFCRGQRGNRT
jgi:hypothetical protein